MAKPPSIPAFTLYGEAIGPAPAAFVHIETIAERSLLLNWEIAPHRHHASLQVLLVHEGQVDGTLDGRPFTQTGPAHVTLPIGSVHGFLFRPGTRGAIITLSQDFLSRVGDGDPLRRLLATGGSAPLPPETARRVGWLAGEMLALSGPGGSTGPLLQTLAEALVRLLPAPDEDEGGSGEDARLALFRQLVERHYARPHGLDFYARALGVSERTLSRLCRLHLGSSPLTIVNRRRAIEAERLLLYTNASVAQVATRLGFDDPSYFSRFFLRMTGRRPKGHAQGSE